VSDRSGGSPGDFELLVDTHDGERYFLQLYVTGMTPRSTDAIARIKSICDEQLAGRYDFEVIDIYQHPELARQEQIIAAPTLIKRLPLPLRRLVGDLSDTTRVLMGLGLGKA
jgi:circadian clock protein KaiB